MYITENIKHISSISLYQAPSNCRVTPATIPPLSENIEILTGGKIFFEWNGEQRTFERGTIFWHLPGEKTIWNTPADAPYRCLSIRVSTYDHPVRTVPRVTFWDGDVELSVFTAEALKCFHDDSIDRDILVPYIYARVCWQAHYYTRRKPDPEYPEFLRLLIKHIGTNLSGELGVKTLSRLSGMSVPYIHACFKEYLGVSPHRYILSRRLQQARNLLAGSELLIKEIGGECGFANIESFYRAFRKYFGLTPGEYRTRHAHHASFNRK